MFETMEARIGANGKPITIGGSEIAAIMGISPFAGNNAFSVWERKTGRSQPTPDNPAFEWGRRLESVVAEAWSEKNARAVYSVPMYQPRTDGLFPWAAASPDRMTPNEDLDTIEGLEVKTANAFAASDWDSGIPEYYKTQGIWYMFVTGAKIWHFAALIGGSDYREFVLRHDPEAEAQIIDAAGTFYRDHILTDIAPEKPFDRSDLAGDIVEGLIVEASEAIDEMFIRAAGVKVQIEALETEKTDLENSILRFIGAGQKLKSRFGSVSWIIGKPKIVTNWESVALRSGATAEMIAADSTEKPGSTYARFTYKK